MTNVAIVNIILALAPMFNLDPQVALAVAYVESDLNVKAVGSKGEIGIYQIMPSNYKQKGYTKAQIAEPLNNIYMGLEMLQAAKNTCVHRGNLNSLICYNVGNSNAKKIRHPASFPYVKKVTKRLLTLISSR